MVRKNWMLGFLGFMGFQGIRGIISGNWIQALWIVWFVWFIYFIPKKNKTNQLRNFLSKHHTKFQLFEEYDIRIIRFQKLAVSRPNFAFSKALFIICYK